jgi:hypothetical protein
MGSLRLGVVLVGLVVAAVTFLPSVAGAAAITDGVPGLQLCTSSTAAQCDLGPIREHFNDYGDVCSYDDCFFASAADWEQVAAGVTPTITTLDLAYKAAGQTFGGGVSAPDLWTYWKASGIDGVYLESETVINKSEASVENGVKARRALIVNDPHALMIGSEQPDIRLAIMIVDGYTPKGPLVVFQDKTLQMTWSQWNAQVQTVWEVAVSKTPPTGTPPPPTSTTSPTATLSLSPSNLTSAGGAATLTYSSENATSCTLTSSPAIWTTATETVACNGTYVDTVAPSTTAQEWTFTFTASNSSGVSATQTQTLSEAVATSTTTQFATPNTIWSGYVVPSIAIVTYAEGEWTIPTINCADTPDGNVSTWIGIGGTGGTTLLQTGIASNCVGGVQQNVGWWEEYPSNPNHEANFTNFPVSDGSQFRAVISQESDGSWETTLSDLTTGLSGYMVTGEAWGVSETGASSFTDQGSTAGLSYPGGYTAEWIVEDDTDSVTQSVYPFANFGSTTFSDLETNLSSWSLTPSETWGIVQNGVTLAAPTTTSSDGFTDTYTGP